MLNRQHRRLLARGPVFDLLFDARHNVLMTRFYGTYVADDIVLRDIAVGRFVARHGLARGILDYTDVEDIDVPMDLVVKRGHAPPMLPGQMRVIVAPGTQTWEMSRLIAALQAYSRKIEPIVVRSLGEAFERMAIVEPRFEPVAEVGLTQWANTVGLALARIDETQGSAERGDEARQQLRTKLLRLSDSVPLTGKARRALPPASAITLSDVLNSSLARTRVTDGDVKACCGSCDAPVSLDICRIVAGRVTSYTCPWCDAVLVVLAPAGDGGPGYPVGGFLVTPTVDLDCLGVRLPKADPYPLPAPRTSAGTVP